MITVTTTEFDSHRTMGTEESSVSPKMRCHVVRSNGFATRLSASDEAWASVLKDVAIWMRKG